MFCCETMFNKEREMEILKLIFLNILQLPTCIVLMCKTYICLILKRKEFEAILIAMWHVKCFKF